MNYHIFLLTDLDHVVYTITDEYKSNKNKNKMIYDEELILWD